MAGAAFCSHSRAAAQAFQLLQGDGDPGGDGERRGFHRLPVAGDLTVRVIDEEPDLAPLPGLAPQRRDGGKLSGDSPGALESVLCDHMAMCRGTGEGAHPTGLSAQVEGWSDGDCSEPG
jgi:hypothetical protein